MNALAVITLLDTILMLATKIPVLFQKATVLKAEIQAIVDEGREPSEAEWDAANVATRDMLATLDRRASDAQDHLDSQS